MRRVVLTILTVLCLSASALAERRVALILAGDGYRTLRPLSNAVNDGRAIETALSGLGFEVYFESNRDLRRMRRALEDFRADAAGADVALVFFAGHGVEIAGENRLLPIDADPASLDRLKQTSLPLTDVTGLVGAIGKVGLVVLDACRGDPFGAAVTGSGRGAVTIAPDVVARARPGLGRVGRADNVLVAFSAAPGATASDGADGHSPFSAALAKYLGSEGLEIRSVMTLVQQEVYDVTRGQQLPYVESGLPRLFFASAGTGALPERERLLLAMADVTGDMRAQVERIAADRDMPLAPLYAALLASDAGALDTQARDRKLAEAADAFVLLRDQLKTMAASDPAVERLRASAQDAISLGAFDTARQDLAAAAKIDGASRQALKASFTERTLSEAETLGLSGGAASATLRYDQAIADYERAMALYGEAGDAAFEPAAADRQMVVLEGLGGLYTTVGDTVAAGRSYRAIQQLLARRHADEPSNETVQRNLAIAHTKLGNVQVALGNLDGALVEFRSALDLLTALTQAPSPDPDWLTSLAVAQDKIGDVLATQGDLPAAVAAMQASLTIKQRLAEAAPDDATRKRDLTVTFDALGGVLRSMGRPQEAQQAYRASLDARLDLAKNDPADPERQRDVSISHDYLGDTARDLGDTPTALAEYSAGQAIIQALVRADPRNRPLARDLSVSDTKLGNVLRESGDLDGALAHYQAALSVAQALAAADPANSMWQRDLSVTLEKVADINARQGDRDSALARYEESLAIMRRLVASDASNADWQRDISITLGEIGWLAAHQRDAERAGAALSESLAIRERLAASEPDNALWQRDLIIAYADYAQVAKNPKQVLTRALDLALALEKSGRLGAPNAPMIDALRQRLERLGRRKK